MELKVIPWEGEEVITEAEVRHRLDEQDLKIYRWSRDPADVFKGHTHGYHKILYIVDGTIKFEFPTRHKTINLKTGDCLELPAGIRHSAVVGEDGVSCLEAHIY